MLLGLVVIGVSVAVLGGQSGLAPDIHPESLSRVPPVQRDSLDAHGKRVWDFIGGGRGMPKTGTGASLNVQPDHRRTDSGPESNLTRPQFIEQTKFAASSRLPDPS